MIHNRSRQRSCPYKDNDVLLEYALGSDAAYLFKISKGGVETVIKIPQGKEEIEGQVSDRSLRATL